MATNVDELAEIVATAKKATESLEDSDLQRVAFARVLEHLLKNGESAPPTQPRASTQPAAAHSAPVPYASAIPSADGVLAEEQQRVDAIARYFKIDSQDVGHIFDVSGVEPVLSVHTSGLAGPRASATREIALLVAGARTALGQETTTSHLRSASDDRNKLDSGDFMQTLGDMQEISVLGKHGSPNRVVRMKVSGAEKAQLLAQRLIGE